MKTNPVISVIVPVYKAEEYLPRCIESIIAQTFVDFEVLLIDDGSPDNSGKICDDYAIKDKRIKVFHKSNGGVSSARNLGLDNAKGIWVSFIDADDYVSPDFFELGDCVGCEVLQKSYVVINEEDNSVEHKYLPEIDSFRTKDDFYRFFVTRRTSALWDKFILRELIGETRFNTKVHIGEDFLFFLSLLSRIKQYKFNRKGYYNYIIRKGSAMEQINRNAIERANIMVENIKNVCSILNVKEEELLRYGIIYQSYINTLYEYRRVLQPEALALVKRYFHEMSLRKLKYVSNEIKFKLFVKKILIKAKSE